MEKNELDDDYFENLIKNIDNLLLKIDSKHEL